jgi:hypothetical protein
VIVDTTLIELADSSVGCGLVRVAGRGLVFRRKDGPRQ